LITLQDNIIRTQPEWLTHPCNTGDLICDPDECIIPGEITLTSDLMTTLGGQIRIATSVRSTDGELPARLGVTDSTEGVNSCKRAR
jgi:hypothetical protein